MWAHFAFASLDIYMTSQLHNYNRAKESNYIKTTSCILLRLDFYNKIDILRLMILSLIKTFGVMSQI